MQVNTFTLGSCSLCGGPVSVALVWHGVIPPTPKCERCGAVKADSYGPVIPMIPHQPVQTQTDTTSSLL